MTTESFVQVHTVQLGNTLTKLSMQAARLNEAGTANVAVDMTSKTVKFQMINAATGRTVVAETDTGVEVTDDANGKVDYDFQAAGVTVPGIYYGYLTVYDGGEGDTFPVETGHLQIHINTLTMSAQEAYRLQLNHASRDTVVLTLTDSAQGTLSNFPAKMNVGDSYLESVLTHVKIYIRDEMRVPLTAIGTKTFADGDFVPKITISQDNVSSTVTGTCVWVPAAGAAEGYLKCEFPKDQTRRAGEGVARLQLMFRWGSDIEILVASQPIEWLNKNIRT